MNKLWYCKLLLWLIQKKKQLIKKSRQNIENLDWDGVVLKRDAKLRLHEPLFGQLFASMENEYQTKILIFIEIIMLKRHSYTWPTNIFHFFHVNNYFLPLFFSYSCEQLNYICNKKLTSNVGNSRIRSTVEMILRCMN